MRRLISAIWIIPFLMCLLVPASAHPGRTDGSGGHTDRSTGEYHYHHGYPAHDHYDMDGDRKDDCPYNFVDKTDTSNRGSSGSVKTTPFPTDPPVSSIDFTVPEFEIPTLPTVQSISVNNSSHQSSATTSKQTTANKESISVSTLLVFVIPLGIAAVVNYFRWKGTEAELRFKTDGTKAVLERYLDLEKKYKELQNEAENLRKDILHISNSEETWKNQASEARLRAASLVRLKDAEIATLTRKIEIIQNEKDELYQKYPFAKTEPTSPLLTQPVILPNDVYFVREKIPVKGTVNERNPFGDFTVYVSTKGKRFHSDEYCGGAYFMDAVHVYSVLNTHTPCAKCALHLPFKHKQIPQWYKDVLELSVTIE